MTEATRLLALKEATPTPPKHPTTYSSKANYYECSPSGVMTVMLVR